MVECIDKDQYTARINAARDPETGRFRRGRGHPGRRIGSKNRKSRISTEEQTKQISQRLGYDVDPIEALAIIATDSSQKAAVRLSAWRSLAGMLYPKKRAIG